MTVKEITNPRFRIWITPGFVISYLMFCLIAQVFVWFFDELRHQVMEERPSLIWLFPDNWSPLLIGLLSIGTLVIHEFSHALGYLINGTKVKEIRFEWSGGSADAASEPKSWFEYIVWSLSGPVMDIFVTCLLFSLMSGISAQKVFVFVMLVEKLGKLLLFASSDSKKARDAIIRAMRRDDIRFHGPTDTF